MTLRECYDAIGGNYEEVLARLRSERLVRKFVLKFLNDKSYELFCDMAAQKNEEEAFRAVHTIKGVCQNLGFTRLLDSSSRMSDALMGQLEADYRMTVDAIQKLSECEG